MTVSAPPCSFYGAPASSPSSPQARPRPRRCSRAWCHAGGPRCSWSAVAMWIPRCSRQRIDGWSRNTSPGRRRRRIAGTDAHLDPEGERIRGGGCPGGDGLFAKLEEVKPALLLLDIMMPKVDGLQLLERLKQDERYRDLPVLMVSSMPPEEATVRALGLGAADFISKPFRVRELLARVEAHIRVGRALAQAREEARSRAAMVDI